MRNYCHYLYENILISFIIFLYSINCKGMIIMDKTEKTDNRSGTYKPVDECCAIDYQSAYTGLKKDFEELANENTKLKQTKPSYCIDCVTDTDKVNADLRDQIEDLERVIINLNIMLYVE